MPSFTQIEGPPQPEGMELADALLDVAALLLGGQATLQDEQCEEIDTVYHLEAPYLKVRVLFAVCVGDGSPKRIWEQLLATYNKSVDAERPVKTHQERGSWARL